MAITDFMMRNHQRSANRDKAPAEPTSIQSVERATRLLLMVAARSTNGSCKELAAAAGLATPTTHHLLSTLVGRGLLVRDEAAHYQLGPEIAVLANAYQRECSVPEYLLAPMHQLADKFGETTYLGGWRYAKMQLLAMAEGHLPVRVSLPSEGRYRDAHARAAGKVLLAYAPERLRESYLSANPLRPLTSRTITDAKRFYDELRRVRHRGFATDEEEFLVGICCISVPVVSAKALVAVYSMQIPMQRFSQRQVELTRALMSTARGVERTIAADSATLVPSPFTNGTVVQIPPRSNLSRSQNQNTT